MKNIILFSLLFVSNVFSQKKITVASTLKLPITDALLIVNNSPKYITDSLGNVTIQKVDLNSSILIRHVKYKLKTFDNITNQDTLFLEEKLEELKDIEIIASSKSKKKKESLFPKISLRNILPENFGKGGSIGSNIEIALYFPNEKKQGNFIRRLKIYTNDYKVLENLQTKKVNKRRNAKFSPIQVNFYTVDSIYEVPEKRIFEQNFIISCQIKEDCAILELSEEEEFEFPSNGIFVILKNLSKEEYEALGFDYPPGITTIGVSKDNKIIPYFRYLHEGETGLWKKYDYLIERQNTYKIGIEFKN
ncbi:hypothetical protein [Flavobacterium sp.]|uniref:hypothetical protein n=1 Tax=Flavobacterium sp. TaxID=239 RepID=UPI004048358F